MHCFVRAVFPLLLTSPALADPPAPQGWRASSSGTSVVYSATAQPGVVLQLNPEEASTASLASWFLGKLDEPVPGVGRVRFGQPRPARPGITMAAGLGSAPRTEQVFVAVGCETAARTKRFALLRMPPDPRLADLYSRQATEIVAAACLRTTVAEAPPAAKPLLGAKPASPASKAAGGGLANSEIAAVLYSWFQGETYLEWTYLLLTDGTARRGVPEAAPADFDRAADQRANPQDWGRWKRSGDKYLVDFGEGFKQPPGQMLRVPGRPGERLAGRFEKSTSSFAIIGAGNWSNWGLELLKDGRFKRWGAGGMGGTYGVGNSAITAGATRDDQGSSVAVGSQGIGGGSSSSTGVTAADLEGTYHIDGWSLELRYRSGAVQRGFFFTDPQRKNIWFEGNELMVFEDAGRR